MKRIMICLIVAAGFLWMLTGCSQYKEERFLGKTSVQIVSEYGEFDCSTMPVSDDGLYRNCRCGYTIRRGNHWMEERLYFITFDSNGMAVACERGYRPGG